MARTSNNTTAIVASNIQVDEVFTPPRYSTQTLFPSANQLPQGSICYNEASDTLFFVGASGDSNYYREIASSSLPPSSLWANGNWQYGNFIYPTLPNNQVVIGKSQPDNLAKLDVAGGIHSDGQISALEGMDSTFYAFNGDAQRVINSISPVGAQTPQQKILSTPNQFEAYSFSGQRGNFSSLTSIHSQLTNVTSTSLTSTSISTDSLKVAGVNILPSPWSEAMGTIWNNNSGRILIGTSSSTETDKLVVNGNQIITNSGNAVLRMRSYSSPYITEIADAGTEFNIRNANPNVPFTFSPSGTERLKISPNGNVNITGSLSVNGIPVSDVGDDWTKINNDIHNVNLTGNVGIGIINPSYPLDVSGSTRISSQLIFPVSGDDALPPDTARIQADSFLGGIKVANDAATNLFRVVYNGDCEVHQSAYINDNLVIHQTSTPLSFIRNQSWNGTTILNAITSNDNVLIMDLNTHIPYGKKLRFANNANASHYYDIVADSNGLKINKNTDTVLPSTILDFNDWEAHLEPQSAFTSGYYLTVNTEYGIELPANSNDVKIKSGYGNVIADMGGQNGVFKVQNFNSDMAMLIQGKNSNYNVGYIKWQTEEGTGQCYVGTTLDNDNSLWLGSYNDNVYIDVPFNKYVYIDRPLAETFYYEKMNNPTYSRIVPVINPVVFDWNGSTVVYGANASISSIVRNNAGDYTITYYWNTTGYYSTAYVNCEISSVAANGQTDIPTATTVRVFTNNAGNGSAIDCRTSVMRVVYQTG